jgi:hypothetical protein
MTATEYDVDSFKKSRTVTTRFEKLAVHYVGGVKHAMIR